MLATIKRLIDYIMMIVGDLKIPLSSMDRLSRQKVNKETQILHVILDQMDLTDIYRASYPKKQQTTRSSQVQMEHSSRLTTYSATRQDMVNLRNVKSFQALFPITIL